jgi:hypothetical protein
MIDNTPDLNELDFGTVGHDREIHIVDGRWHGSVQDKGNTSLCSLPLNRRLRSIDGKERRVCRDCNERWLS